MPGTLSPPSRVRHAADDAASGIRAAHPLSSQRVHQTLASGHDRIRLSFGCRRNGVSLRLSLCRNGVSQSFYGVFALRTKLPLFELLHDIVGQQQWDAHPSGLEHRPSKFLKVRIRIAGVKAEEHTGGKPPGTDLNATVMIGIEVGHETAPRETMSEHRIAKFDLELDRGDLFWSVPQEHDFADVPQPLSVQREGDERERESNGSTSLDNATHASDSLPGKGDTYHADREDCRCPKGDS
jgi:hypothetical protein